MQKLTAPWLALALAFVSCGFYHGRAPVSTLGMNASAVAANATTAFCFTNATSAGSVTASWYLQPLGYVGTSGNGWLAKAVDDWTQDKVTASSNSVGLVSYESGQTYVPGNSTPYETLYYAAMRDSRMGAAYTTYYTSLHAQSSGVVNIFADIGNFTQFGMWGNLESIQQLTSPRYQSSLVNFLLNRDLDPASNDNSPAWVYKAA